MRQPQKGTFVERQATLLSGGGERVGQGTESKATGLPSLMPRSLRAPGILDRIKDPVTKSKPEKRWQDGLYLDQPEEPIRRSAFPGSVPIPVGAEHSGGQSQCGGLTLIVSSLSPGLTLPLPSHPRPGTRADT